MQELMQLAEAGSAVPQTVSIGSAAQHPGEALDRVLERADQALYSGQGRRQ